MGKIFGSSINKSQSRGGMSRMEEIKAKMQESKLQKSKMINSKLNVEGGN